MLRPCLRLPLSAFGLMTLILCGQGQGKDPSLEFELLRAPALTVAKALVESGGSPAKDAQLRKILLAGGAATLAHCAVSGPYRKEQKYEKMKITAEPFLFEYAALWQEQAMQRKRGEEVTPFEDGGGETHESGCRLKARFDHVDAGTQVSIQFKWAGPPVVRKVNTWPVKDRIAKVIQDRVWEVTTRWTANDGAFKLVAAAPEPPLGDGSATGFVCVAFGKVVDAGRARTSEPPSLRATQCWTFEMPEDAARKWLADRNETNGDEKELRALLQKNGPAPLTGFYSLLRDGRERGDETGRVNAALEWHEPRGFEPSDTRCVPFIPVPNDEYRSTVGHRFETEDGRAGITQPVGGVKWQRWYGATRGAVDEPEGVESSATGATSCEFALQRVSGRVFLANAHTCGPKMRLTFARVFVPQKPLRPVYGNTLQILETPTESWLPRLTAGDPVASFMPDLSAALAKGTAQVLHTEYCTPDHEFPSWKREDTWPWMAIGRGYINPCIHEGKFCFNPRFSTGSNPACLMELSEGNGLNATICGEPVKESFGLWLPGVPGFTAETSRLSLSAWSHFKVQWNFTLPEGRDLLLQASLGRAWRHPEQAAIHWFLFRSDRLPDTPAAEPVSAAAEPALASFTVMGTDGAVLTHMTLPVSGTVEDGRILQSIEPRRVDEKHYFQEAVPPEAADGGKTMYFQPEIVPGLDGTRLSITDGVWTLEHNLVPARKITETLTALTEHYDDKGNYKSEPIPVSSERFVLKREKVTGRLPTVGGTMTLVLEGDRLLTVRVR